MTTKKMFFILLSISSLMFHSAWSQCTQAMAAGDEGDLTHIVLQKMDTLISSSRHREYVDSLNLLKESYERKDTFVAFFHKEDHATANQTINVKSITLLNAVEERTVSPKEAPFEVARIYGSTLSDLNYKAFHLEDLPPMMTMWRKVFSSDKEQAGGVSLKLAQTDNVAEIDYWLPVLDKNTYLFLDADLPGHSLVGFRIAADAIKFGFNPRRIIMASSQVVIAKEKGLRSVDKDAVLGKKILLEESEQPEL